MLRWYRRKFAGKIGYPTSNVVDSQGSRFIIQLPHKSLIQTHQKDKYYLDLYTPNVGYKHFGQFSSINAAKAHADKIAPEMRENPVSAVNVTLLVLLTATVAGFAGFFLGTSSAPALRSPT